MGCQHERFRITPLVWSPLVWAIVICVGATRCGDSYGQDKTLYPNIPRVDVHTHVANDMDAIDRYLNLRSRLRQQYGADLAFWINLGDTDSPIEDNDAIFTAAKGRMVCCISDYSAHDGLQHAPNQLAKSLERGFVGYKIWSGPADRVLRPEQAGFRYVDDVAHEPTFAAMEKIGMVAASLHVADPCGPFGKRTKWLPDPVEYWRQITAWRRVLERHPNLVAVNAHGMWAMCQDGQIDYLRNMLSTFPNLHVDLAATFQYYHLVDRDNLRDFMIEYSDRIVFGTDVGGWDDDEETEQMTQRYSRCFEILETDKIVPGSFFGDEKIRGLALPREALENIYYKNAARIYPRVKESMAALGYEVE